MSRRLAVLGVALLLTGCVETEHPLVPPGEAVAEPRLEGVWQGDGTVYSVQRVGQEPASYRVVEIRGGEAKVISEGPLLFRVGRRYFLVPNPEKNFFPLRVSFAGDELRVRELNWRWLDDYLATHRKALKHHHQGSGGGLGSWPVLVLEAPTKELQAFVEKHMDELFSTPVKRFTRVGKAALPPLAKEGLASRRQRTFDYWDEVRYQLKSVPFWHTASRAEAIENCAILARVIQEIPTDLIDREATDAGRHHAALFRDAAKYLSDRTEPADVRALVDLLKSPRAELPAGQQSLEPIRRQALQAADEAEQARERLGQRYGEAFPPWRWRVLEPAAQPGRP
jgi:hypothetical protein